MKCWDRGGQRGCRRRRRCRFRGVFRHSRRQCWLRLASLRLYWKTRKTNTRSNQTTKKKKKKKKRESEPRKTRGRMNIYTCSRRYDEGTWGEMNEREKREIGEKRNGLEMSGQGDGELRSSRTPPPRSFLTVVKNDQAVCVDEAGCVVVMGLL